MKLSPNGHYVLPGSMETVACGPLLALPAALAAIGTAASTATAAVGGLSTLGTIAGIGSTILGTVGAISQGQAAKEAGQYEATQLQQRANEERALGQRKAFQAQDQKDRALGTLVTRAAAGGGAVDDPTVLNLGGDIENRGETQALMEFYRGDTAADRSMNAASAAIYKGKAAQQASYFKAGGTILDGIGSLAKKYG